MPRTLIALALACIAGCGSQNRIDPQVACLAGAYRDADGDLATLVPADGGVRVRLLDGRSARLEREQTGRWSGPVGWSREGPTYVALEGADCGTPGFQLAIEGRTRSFERLSLATADLEFESRGVRIVGRLVLPASPPPWPLVVLVHGSEDWSALDHSHWQHLLPAAGIAVVVYDKRGTGRSGGKYTQDFALLADDAALALEAGRAGRSGHFSRVGYFGGSQGGWVAPLAATATPVDFVVAAYGMAESPAAEDREEVFDNLRAAGFADAATLAKAREITDATARLMASGLRDGHDELADLRRRYRHEPWYDQVEGEYSGDLLRRLRPAWVGPLIWPFIDRGTPWNYEPVATLRALEVRQLWVLAGRDREAPSEGTRRILQELIAQDRPIELVLFPEADHGILLFREDEGGRRVPLRTAPSYYRLVIDWIHDRPLHPGDDARRLGAAQPGPGAGAVLESTGGG